MSSKVTTGCQIARASRSIAGAMREGTSCRKGLSGKITRRCLYSLTPSYNKRLRECSQGNCAPECDSFDTKKFSGATLTRRLDSEKVKNPHSSAVPESAGRFAVRCDEGSRELRGARVAGSQRDILNAQIRSQQKPFRGREAEVPEISGRFNAVRLFEHSR
jgi:hypothetical protein